MILLTKYKPICGISCLLQFGTQSFSLFVVAFSFFDVKQKIKKWNQKWKYVERHYYSPFSGLGKEDVESIYTMKWYVHMVINTLDKKETAQKHTSSDKTRCNITRTKTKTNNQPWMIEAKYVLRIQGNKKHGWSPKLSAWTTASAK